MDSQLNKTKSSMRASKTDAPMTKDEHIILITNKKKQQQQKLRNNDKK